MAMSALGVLQAIKKASLVSTIQQYTIINNSQMNITSTINVKRDIPYINIENVQAAVKLKNIGSAKQPKCIIYRCYMHDNSKRKGGV